jgi:hypothetical protein
MVTIPTKFNIQIPYFASWESPELVEDILQGKIASSADPKWKSSGAKTKEEYEHWAINICGIACFKMILAKLTGKIYLTIKLVKLALKYNCIDIEKGLYYRQFCEFAKADFDLEASFREDLTVSIIQEELAAGNFVIASVHGSIRNELLDFEPIKKGGHLVLITGFNQESRTITFHDPAGFYQKTQVDREVTEEIFNKFSSNRGIIIKP